MNKEVKEIIDDIKDFIKDKKQIVCYGKKTMEILLDYITSLEEKVETEHKAYMGTVNELTETATKLEKATKFCEDNLCYYDKTGYYIKNGCALLDLLQDYKGSDK